MSLLRFHEDLYREVSGSSGGDIVVSTLSVAAILRLAFLGARGTTREELASVLHVQRDANSEAFSAVLSDVISGAVEGTILRMANRIWTDASYEAEITDEFINTAAACFGSGVASVDFRGQPDLALRRINEWTSEQTSGTIPALLSAHSVDPETTMMLTNALYFRAEWTRPFDPTKTRQRPFHRANGDKSAVAMMHKSGRASYRQFFGGEILHLYYRDQKHRLVLILPALEKAAALDAYVGDPNVWGLPCRVHDVDLALPRFTASASTALLPALRALGLDFSTSPTADFSGIARSGGLGVSDVVHRAVLEVNEWGSEAAAATAMGLMLGASPPPIQMVFNRPFGFLLERIDGHVPLFAGRYTGE